MRQMTIGGRDGWPYRTDTPVHMIPAVSVWTSKMADPTVTRNATRQEAVLSDGSRMAVTSGGPAGSPSVPASDGGARDSEIHPRTVAAPPTAEWPRSLPRTLIDKRVHAYPMEKGKAP
jgi:hypothetical protein